MKKNNQILYAVIGVLSGAVLVLGALFFLYAQKLKTMDQQVQSMKETMEETVAQVQKETSGGSKNEDVESEYVSVEEEQEEVEKENKVTPTPTQEVKQENAAAQFNDLQPQMENLLENFQNQVGGTWALYVEDLETGASMSMNNKKMQAASLIKLYIMGAVYERYDTLSASANIDELLKQMITVSDNDAANELVRLLGEGDEAQGMRVVNAFCTQYNYTSTSMGRMLLTDNSITDNYTSVEDCAKFLYHMYIDKWEYSDKMMQLLLAQTRRSKLPAGIPDGISVGNKTGELDDVQNDAAIVYADKPYVVCIMTEDLQDSQDAVKAIASLSNSIYGYINET